MSIYQSPPSPEPAEAEADEKPTTPFSWLAVASLVLSVLWLWGLGSLAAVVVGHLARKDIDQDGLRGGGMRALGLVIGYVGIVATLVFVLGGGGMTLLGGTQPDRAADTSSGNAGSPYDTNDGGLAGMLFGG